MNRILVLVVAGGLWLGTASASRAQFALSVGNPYTGGVSIGVPYAGAYGGYYGGYPAYGYGYGVAPGVSYYSSGYYGLSPAIVAPYTAPVITTTYGYAPYYRPADYGFAPYRRGFFGVRRGYVGGFW